MALPIGQLVMIVDQLQRRNSDLIAHISHNQTSRDPAKLNENVRLLRELDLNLHKVRTFFIQWHYLLQFEIVKFNHKCTKHRSLLSIKRCDLESSSLGRCISFSAISSSSLSIGGISSKGGRGRWSGPMYILFRSDAASLHRWPSSSSSSSYCIRGTSVQPSGLTRLLRLTTCLSSSMQLWSSTLFNDRGQAFTFTHATTTASTSETTTKMTMKVKMKKKKRKVPRPALGRQRRRSGIGTA